MRCFLACFTSSKPNKRFYLANSPPINHHRDVTAETLPLQSTTLEIPITQPLDNKLEAQLNCNGESKVTSFDFNYKNDDVLSPDEAATDVLVVGKNEDKSGEKEEESSNGSKSIPNFISKEESEALDLKNDGNSDRNFLVEEELSESLFSLSLDSRKQTYGIEEGEKEISSPMPKCGSFHQGLKSRGSNGNSSDRTQTQSVDSVLTPVENLPQLKATPTLTVHNQDKENITLEQDTTDKCSFELLCKKERAKPDQKNVLGKQIAVDASLSSWLIEPETTPLSKGSTDSAANSAYTKAAGSPPSAQGRTILGALTVKQVPGSITPRQQKRQSSDDVPVLGTVASYWRHTGRTVDSDSSSSSKGVHESVKKYAEDESENWNSPSFEARLDRALCKIVAQV